MTTEQAKPLNPRAAAILTGIRDRVATAGYPPTVRELADAVGAAPSTVVHHLARLKQAGYITVDPGRARGIRVLEPGPVLTAVPEPSSGPRGDA